MAPKFLVLTVLLALLVSGCSGNGDKSNGETLTTSSSETSSTNSTMPNTPATLEPVEIFNQSFRFKAVTGGNDISASFEVPSGMTNLNFTMVAYADCPAWYGRSEPRVTFASPSNQNTTISSFGGNRGTMFSGNCSPSQGAGQDELGPSDASAASETGTWTIRSNGEFSGSVRLIVIADAAS